MTGTSEREKLRHSFEVETRPAPTKEPATLYTAACACGWTDEDEATSLGLARWHWEMHVFPFPVSTPKDSKQ